MPFTTYADQKLISLLLGGTAYSIPGTLYVGLSTTAPSQTQGGAAPYWNFTEPVGNAYARPPVVNNTTNWVVGASQPATGYEQQNGTTITFPQSTGAWAAGASLGYFGLWDAITAGNLILFGTCSPAQAVAAANITISFAVGALTATLN